MTGQRLNDFSMMKEKESVVTAGAAGMIGGAVANTSRLSRFSLRPQTAHKG
jgi:NADPH-dependent curcumin reductase CurA